MCDEGGFVFISFLDLDVVISPSEVKFGEYRSSLKLFDDTVGEWKWEFVFDCCFV